MAVVLRMFDKEFRAMVDRKVDAFLSAVGLELHRIARKKASISNRGVRVGKGRTRGKGGRFVKGQKSRTVYPHSSKSGESPRRRTGFGHENIAWGYSRQRKVARVGYTRNARYMTFHELGIRYRKGKQQRPTIVPALRDNHRRLMVVGRNAARAVQ